MSEENKNLERSIQAVKVVVIDLKKKVSKLTEDVKNQEANLKEQHDRLQTIAETVDTAVNVITRASKEQMELRDIDPGRLKELDEKVDLETERLNQIEKRFDDLDQTLAALREDLQGFNKQLEELGTNAPTDTNRFDQIEAEQGTIENNMAVLRGKLEEIDDTLGTLKTTALEAPLTDLNQILERLNALENIIQNIEPTPPAAQPMGIDPDRLRELSAKFDVETNKLNQIEKRFGELDQTMASLREDLQGFQQQLKEIGTPSPAETDRLGQFEAEQRAMEEKQMVLRGKLEEIEDILGTLKKAASGAPSTDLSEIFMRLDALENTIPKIEPTTPAAQPAHEPTPSPAPHSVEAPESAVRATIGGLTMKEKVRKIIEELVTASAITIASRLQVSTAMIRSVLKELEEEGVVVLSGDIESGRFEVKLL